MMKTGILIIDDDDQFRQALVDALEVEGFHLEQADSVADGLALLDVTPHLRVIILDLDLPEVKGSVLLDTLKRRASSHRVIVHTAHPEMLKAKVATRLNVFKYIPKGGRLKQDPLLEPLKHAIDQAFKDIESENLKQRINAHLKVQKLINLPTVGREVLREICSYALQLTEGYTCHIRLLDSKKGDYELSAYAGPEHVEALFRDNKRLSEHFSGMVAQKRTKQLYQDLQSNSEFKKFKERLLSEGISAEAKVYLDRVRSAYIIPIKTGLFDDKNQVDAVFNISGSEPRFFTNDRLDLIDEFVTQVNLAISKKWLQEKRAEIHNDYSASNQLLVSVSEKLQEANLQQIYKIVLTQIANIIGPEMVSLFLYERDTGLIEKKAEYVGNEMHYDFQESYAPGECLTGNVFARGESLLINDEPTSHKYYSSLKEIDCLDVPSRRIQHYLGVPLVAGKRVIGVIRAINKKSSYYDESYPDVEGNLACLLSRGFSRDCNVILQIITNHLAVTLKNLELITQLNSLAHVGQRISANYGLETDNLLGLIVRETAEVMNAAVCMLFLMDAENKKIVLRQSYPMPLIQNAYYYLGERSTGKVAQTGKPIYKGTTKGYVGKYDRQIRQFLRIEYGKQTDIASFMIAPITIQDDSPVRKNKIIGVIKLVNKKNEDSHFDANDLSLFQTFASQVSVALVMSERNRSLFKLVQGVGHEIANSVNLIVPDTDLSRKKVETLTRLTLDRDTEFLKLVESVAHEIDRPAKPIAPNAQAPQSAGNSLADLIEHSRTFSSKEREHIDRLGKFLANIYNAAEDARDFSRDLLGFSDSRFIERKCFDINGLIRHEVLQLKDHPPPSVRNASDVGVDFALTDEPIFCDIYEIPFRHVIRNIVANAYQAMEGNTSARLTVRSYLGKNKKDEHPKTACIAVSDTGKGIEPGDIGRLFDSDFTKREGGNGLGLWLVKLSLLRMDAAISVRSKLKVGTTFTIELPIADRQG